MIFLALFLLSCEKIVWKKGEILPYKIEHGKYVLNLYELEYPNEFQAKEKFLEDLQNELIPLVTSGTSLMILLNESFIKDLLHIEKVGILPEEVFLKKSASQLTQEEQERLFNAIGEKVTKSQDVLNLQIRYILRILNREVEFEQGKIYTELFKENLLSNIIKIRKRIITIFTSSFISLFIKLDSIYKKQELDPINREYLKHYYRKNIELKKGNNISKDIQKYEKRANIYIADMEKNDASKLFDSEMKIPSTKEFILNNQKYEGYIIRNSIIYLVGGKEHIADNENYDITFKIVPIKLSEISQVEAGFVLRDLYRTKEDKIKEKNKFMKEVEKVKQRFIPDKNEASESQDVNKIATQDKNVAEQKIDDQIEQIEDDNEIQTEDLDKTNKDEIIVKKEEGEKERD